MSIFDNDALLDRAYGGGRRGEPDEIRLSTNADNHLGKSSPRIRIALGVGICKRMGWIDGDKVMLVFSRAEKFMGLQRTNDKVRANTLRYSSGRPGSSLCMTLASKRIADDLRKPTIDYIGHGRSISKMNFNQDAVYWRMEP